MWSSYWDGYSRAPLRIGIATIAILEFAVEAWAVASMAADPAHFPATGPLSGALQGLPWAAWAIYALVAVGLLGLATNRRPITGAVWALAWMLLLSQWQTQLFGSPSRNAFFPGAALLGWTLGSVWARALPNALAETSSALRIRERLAEAGALGCIGAAYAGSATSKLLAAGATWADASQVRALVLWQSPVATWGWLLDYRQALLVSPGYARLAAIATLTIEMAGLLLIFGKRLRLVAAVALLGLHVNIILLCTMPYLEPMALLLLLALPWPQLLRSARVGGDGSPAPEGARDPHSELLLPTRANLPPRVLALLLALAALGWILAPYGWRG